MLPAGPGCELAAVGQDTDKFSCNEAGDGHDKKCEMPSSLGDGHDKKCEVPSNIKQREVSAVRVRLRVIIYLFIYSRVIYLWPYVHRVRGGRDEN